MTTNEKLATIKVGEIITDKGILYNLKRKGLIWDYSKWGYLESIRLESSTEKTDFMYFLSSKGKFKSIDNFENAVRFGSRQNICSTDKTYKDISNMLGGIWDTIKVGEMEFDYEFVDGCFNPYLKRIK
jgi:hypothetical protein